jgi:RNA polymerase sigma factor (sigma-70 family)
LLYWTLEQSTKGGEQVGRQPDKAVLGHLQTLFSVGVAGNLTDSQLLERFATQRGDVAELAFAVLVERHGPMVLRTCRSIARDEHDAQDAFQATFLVLLRKRRSLWVRDSLGPWLHRVACRAAMRTRTDAARRLALEQKATRSTRKFHTDGDPTDRAAILQEEIDRLPERYRLTLVLCDLEDRTYEEAARLLSCPVGTVRSRLARARERLRSRLVRRGLAPAGIRDGEAVTKATPTVVPLPLVGSTSQAALQVLASGLVKSATISGSVIELTQGVLKMIALSQGKSLVVGSFLAIALAAGVGSLAYRATAAKQPAAPAAPPVKAMAQEAAARFAPQAAARPGVDLYGDPLPPGARIRLGTLRFRQEGTIDRLAYSPYGKAIVTAGTHGSADGLQVWDAVTGRPVRRIDVGIGNLRDFQLSRDGKVVAAVGFAPLDPARPGAFSRLTVTDFATGRQISFSEWQGRSDAMYLALSPDAATIAMGEQAGVVRLWDAAGKGQRQRLKIGQWSIAQALAFSPDGRLLAAGGDDNGGTHPIHLFDLSQGREIRKLTAHKRPILSLAFSPDGKILASAARDEPVILWDVTTWRELRRLPGPLRYSRGLAFTPDGTAVASASTRLMGEGGVLNVWDVQSGRLRLHLDDTPFSKIAYAPDGKTLASAEGPVLHLLDPDTGRDRRATSEAHHAEINTLLFADSGRTLVSGSADRTVRVWDLTTGQQRLVLKHEGWVRSMALSPDGKTLATGVYYPEGGIALWELATGKKLATWPGKDQRAQVRAVVFSTDGTALLSLWQDGSMRHFEVATRREVPTVQPKLSQAPNRMFDPVANGVFSPDGALAGACSPLHVAFVDVATGKEILKVQGEDIPAFSEDSKTLAVSSYVRGSIENEDGRRQSAIELSEGRILLFDVATKQERLGISRLGSYWFWPIALSPDGKTVAASEVGSGSRVRLYSTIDGRELVTIRGYRSQVSSLCFSPDGTSLAAELKDSSILVWDARPDQLKQAGMVVEPVDTERIARVKALIKPRRKLYDRNADANEQVAAAAAQARRDGKRILVMFGFDGCVPCFYLHKLLESDTDIHELLQKNYVLLLVDHQAPHAEELLKKCQGDLKNVGFPFLAVLSPDGQVVTRQKTDPFEDEEGERHDPKRVKEFLSRWIASKP